MRKKVREGEERRIRVRDRRASQAPVAIADERPAEVEEGVGRPGVIIVEDDAELSLMLKFALETTGYTVTVFSSGPAALQSLLALSTNGPRHVLLLADDLAGMDGHTLHEQLQAARPGRFVVAFLSVRMSDADQIRALRGGAVDFLIKPISIPVLLVKLEVWLRRCLDA